MRLTMKLLHNEPDNPFRPGGDLSKEASEIVDAIQTGKQLDSFAGADTGAEHCPDSTDQELENLATQSLSELDLPSLNEQHSGDVIMEKATLHHVEASLAITATKADEVKRVVIPEEKVICCAIT